MKLQKIEYARSGAWSDMGASVSIDSSLNFKYWGDYKNAKQKYYTGKIDNAFWDTLNIRLEEAKIKTVSATNYISCKDCEYYELIVHWNNKTRRILRADIQQSDSITHLFRWLNSSYNFVKLRQVKDSIKFETTAHFILRSSIKQIKFPPPDQENN